MATTGERTMNAGAGELTIFGAVVGWMVTVFGFGRAYGVLKTRVEAAETDIKELNRSMSNLLRCFVDADGEPRLVSYPALDKIQNSCRKLSDVRLDNHEEILGKHDGKLDEILKGIASITGKISNGNGVV